jgi:VCBS repeat-containing protein
MADTLPTGSRIIDFAQNTLVTDTFLDQQQDEIINALEARIHDVTGNAIVDSAVAWTYSASTSSGAWQCSTSGAILTLPLTLRVDETITALDFTIQGSSATGGTVEIQERQLVTGTGNGSFASWATVSGTATSNPWNTSNFVDRVTVSGLSDLVAPGYVYRVLIQKAADAVASAIGNVLITTQFSTG